MGLLLVQQRRLLHSPRRFNKNPVSVITNADTDFGTDENDDVYYQYFYGIADNLADEMAFHTRKK